MVVRNAISILLRVKMEKAIIEIQNRSLLTNNVVDVVVSIKNNINAPLFSNNAFVLITSLIEGCHS